jgi:hypothetical protein
MVERVEDSEETIEAPGPDARFSADDDLASLWIKAYQGEVSGEALFGRMADLANDPDQKGKWEVLRLLEAKTREACVPAMERNGLPTEPVPAVVSEAEGRAELGAEFSWADLMGLFEPITTEFILLYQRIGEISEADEAEVEILVAHEVALREFARRELAGRTDDSLALIEALPHMH